MKVPDAYDQWLAHEAKQEQSISQRPVCSECDNPIQDEQAFYINSEWICEKCMDTYRKWVEDFCE